MTTDARIEETLAALRRGERIPCPHCGAKLSLLASDHGPGGFYVWACDTTLPEALPGEPPITADDFRGRIGDTCYERQLAALRAEVERQRQMLHEAVARLFHYDLADYVADKINVYLNPTLERNFFSPEERAALGKEEA